MCGRRWLVALLWLVGLAAGGKCLAAGGADRKPGQVVTVHHQQTIITMQLTGEGQLSRCDTIEVNFADEERKALAAIRRERPVTEVSLPHLLETLQRCQKLDYVRHRRQPGGQRAQETRPKWDSAMLLRGLVPGTKWCGLGDTAKGWNDLGPNAELDLCCRTHDLCPVKVKAYKRRYGLFNWGVYTKSHCACDQEFYRCLKSSSVREAEHVGRIFFDLLQPQCVQGPSCAPDESADTCLEKQKAGAEPAALRFFDQLQRYESVPPRVADSAGGRGGSRKGAGEQSGGEHGSRDEEVVQIAVVGQQAAPTKAPSGGGGGLSSFFSNIWKLG